MIRKLILTHLKGRTFLMSRLGLGLLFLMPISEKQCIISEQEYIRRKESGKTATTADLEKAEKKPQMPLTK